MTSPSRPTMVAARNSMSACDVFFPAVERPTVHDSMRVCPLLLVVVVVLVLVVVLGAPRGGEQYCVVPSSYSFAAVQYLFPGFTCGQYAPMRPVAQATSPVLTCMARLSQPLAPCDVDKTLASPTARSQLQSGQLFLLAFRSFCLVSEYRPLCQPRKGGER